MVYEDDFFILNENNYNQFINNFNEIRNNNDWDITVLTPRGDTVKKIIMNI